MTFIENLSKINKLVFLFGISPYLLNRKTNKFECSVPTLIYTTIYFLCISIAIFYMAFTYYLMDGQMFQSTFTILQLLQQATVMFIFYSIMFNLLSKRQEHADFLNSLVELEATLAKFHKATNKFGIELISLRRQIIFIVCFFFLFGGVNSFLDRNRMQNFEHVWNVMQFFQTISITLIAHYIRCFATILNQRCAPIFEKLDAAGDNLRYTNDNGRQRILEVMNCFEAFDEVMHLKTRLSDIFGVQLLLNSAFDFIMLTISVYGLLYFQAADLSVFYYLLIYSLPHAIKCVLTVLELDTLANQIGTLRRCALNVPCRNDQHLTELMDLIFLKINHMEREKYVTANDFYPVNRSMLYGMGAAIVTHMLIIFQFQQWEDSQPKNVKLANSSHDFFQK